MNKWGALLLGIGCWYAALLELKYFGMRNSRKLHVWFDSI